MADRVLTAETAALRTEIKGVVTKIDALDTNLRTEIKGLDTNLRTEIKGVETKIQGVETNLRTKIDALDKSLSGDVANNKDITEVKHKNIEIMFEDFKQKYKLFEDFLATTKKSSTNAGGTAS